VISILRGVLLARSPASYTIDVGGVGFQVAVPERTAAAAPQPGAEIELHTHLHVRENALDLYGFATTEERSIFRALLGVSGIGPRTAIAVLSRLSADEVVSAIEHKNTAAFCRAPGVGKKTAQRILLELAEKFDLGAVGGSGARVAAAEEAIQALVTLGYTEVQASKAVAEIRSRRAGDVETAELIREALQLVGGRS